MPVLRSQVPLSLRFDGSVLTMVGSGGGPVGGDRTELELEIGAGARLEVTSSAATVALPGPPSPARRPSRAGVAASVGPGAHLVWDPQPGVAAKGCDHRPEYVVDMDATATLEWFDRVVLGRFGEAPGRWITSATVAVDGNPLHRSEVHLGEGGFCGTPGSLNWVRVVGSVLVVRPRWRDHPPGPAGLDGPGYVGEVMPLAGPGALVTVMSADYPALDGALRRARTMLAP